MIGPFLFKEQTVMLDLFGVPQTVHLQPNILFQQDAAPTH
jgi:hypothetical protein